MLRCRLPAVQQENVQLNNLSRCTIFHMILSFPVGRATHCIWSTVETRRTQSIREGKCFNSQPICFRRFSFLFWAYWYRKISYFFKFVVTPRFFFSNFENHLISNSNNISYDLLVWFKIDCNHEKIFLNLELMWKINLSRYVIIL